MTCTCGFVVHRTDTDEFVAIAQAHARDAHGIRFTRGQVLALARPKTHEPSGTPGDTQETFGCGSNR